ncbi:MAG: winged helix-turn-helix domain-containing protein [Rhodobacteraceae bacterium]|nr:winged helix-turn-helix domain-containing protein [Paracoccaceae bacterium]
MKSEPALAEAAALIGDPARANMLSSLQDGCARTAKELASIALIGAPTASAHLAKLVEGGLLKVEKQGRHRYYRLADADVAAALEALAILSARTTPASRRPGPRDADMRRLRRCYDHLAGEVAVALVDAWVAKGWLAEVEEDFELTEAGADGFAEFGVDLAALRHQRRAFARRCLDWSERRAHLAGSLGAGVMSRMMEISWVERDAVDRTMTITPRGAAGLRERFGVNLE